MQCVAGRLAFLSFSRLLTNSPESIPRHELEPLWGWTVAPNAVNNCFWHQSLDSHSHGCQEKDSKLKPHAAFCSSLNSPRGKWMQVSCPKLAHLLPAISILVFVTGSHSIVLPEAPGCWDDWCVTVLGFCPSFIVGTSLPDLFVLPHSACGYVFLCGISLSILPPIFMAFVIVFFFSKSSFWGWVILGILPRFWTC